MTTHAPCPHCKANVPIIQRKPQPQRRVADHWAKLDKAGAEPGRLCVGSGAQLPVERPQ